jgi:hypothetical protein
MNSPALNTIVKASVLAALAGASSLAAADDFSFYIDFGKQVESLAKLEALPLFGIFAPLGASSSVQLTAAEAELNPAKLVTVAPGLKVSKVSAAANLGANIDMIVLWPNDSAPTHLIACNEQGASNVGVQRIRLSDGVAEDIIASGLVSCDPAEITPWGTVVIGEENGTSGRTFEIIDPLHTTGVTVTGSGASTVIAGVDAANVRRLGALGQLSYEGVSVLPNGVVYYQDENRPSATDNGGGYFKFIPTNLWAGGAPISNLDQSPLSGGRVFGLRMGRNSGNTDIGAGNNTGRGVWAEIVDGQVVGSTTINRSNLRAAATALKLFTGYRPEDQDIDKGALAQGKVRICGTNTGQDSAGAGGDNNFGETFCITDGTVADAATIATSAQTLGGITYTVNTGAGTTVPEYQLLVTHFLDFGMPDNIAYQPGRGNWLIQEDGDGATYTPARNNDIWSCTDDGADLNLQADACVKVLTVNDLSAETTGGVFNATGKEYYLSVQHNITGHGVILKVTGWR